MRKNFIKKIIAMGLAVTTAIAAMSTSALAAQSTQYTGKPITPSLELYDDDILLVEGVDYELAYENNTNVGTGYIIVTYIGNYEGTRRIPFEITPRVLNSDDNKTIVTDIDDLTYSGSELTPVPGVKYKDYELVPDVDFEMEYEDNIDVGIGSAIVKFIGNYTGEILKHFNINVLHLTQDDLTILPIADTVWTGEPVYPEVGVKYGDILLEKDKDYEVTYSDNTNIGTGKASIKLKGNYSGEAEATYRIVEKALTDDDVTVSDIPEQVYTGNPIEPKPVVTVADKVLTEGNDYEIVYSNNTNVSDSAKMDIIFKGDYTGKVSREYTIIPRNITYDDITVNIDRQTYTGQPIQPKVTVKFGDITLKQDTDFTVSYSDNIDVGTAKALITFIGNYSGETEKAFEIVNKQTSSGSGGGGGVSYRYNVSVKDNNGKTVYTTRKETTDTITLTLPSNRTLDDETIKYTVVVTDKKKLPLEGKTVILVDKNKKQVSGVTNADGTVVLPVDEVAPVEATTTVLEHNSYISGYVDGSFNPDGNISRSETAAILYRTLPERYSEEFAKTQDDFAKYFEGIEDIDEQALNFADSIFDVAFGENEEIPENSGRFVTAMMEILTKNFPFTISEVKEFKDMVPDAWYTNPINAMTSMGFINGYTDDTFRPDNYITRAEFVTMIMQNTDLEEIKDLPFNDVTDDMWAGKYISAAYNAGYISGYEDGSFLPNANITRAEAVAIINRVIGRTDMYYDTVLPFNDVKTSHWAYTDIAEASITHKFTVANN